MSSVIFVTGFGPFAGHEEKNASWEAVKLMPDTVNIKNQVYQIKKIEIPVTYEAVDTVVNEVIWSQKPLLVIHVGVHASITQINLESCSKASGFCKSDYDNKCLPCDKINLKNNVCNDMLITGFDVDAIVNKLNVSEGAKKFVKSCNVGNYLCGYIYVLSLDQDKDRTLFIHVPKIDNPYSSPQVKDGILKVVEECLLQLDNSNKL